ncbi:hypothetical protein ACIREE_24195 [Streptomyces sp. NPDC102467]
MKQVLEPARDDLGAADGADGRTEVLTSSIRPLDPPLDLTARSV